LFGLLCLRLCMRASVGAANENLDYLGCFNIF